jgi:hypothetical protein
MIPDPRVAIKTSNDNSFFEKLVLFWAFSFFYKQRTKSPSRSRLTPIDLILQQLLSRWRRFHCFGRLIIPAYRPFLPPERRFSFGLLGGSGVGKSFIL